MLQLNKILRLPLLLFFSLIFIRTIRIFLIRTQFNTYLVELNLFYMRGTWFRFIIIIDKIRVSFSIVVMLISFCVFSFACRYIREDVFKFRFGLILIIFVLSINILIFSGSIFLLLLGWDGLGISSFALIIYYHNVTRLNAGYLTLLTNRLGDVVIIITIPLILFVGYYNIYPLDTSYNFIIFFLCLAALTKRAQYPFRA